MYELHTAKGKQEKLAHLSDLIRKVAMVPEPYLSRKEASAVIEYLCDIEYELISQLNRESHKSTTRKDVNIEVLKSR